MDDLTLLYISASRMPEKWVKYQTSELLKVVKDTPIISVTQKPLDLGLNLLDTEPISYWNIYMQMLRAAKLAKTPYVAMVEDDTLYSRKHFTQFRPPKDKVSYNCSRWSLFSWRTHPNIIYCLRQNISNCSLIAPTELLIEALTERHEKHPNGVANHLGVGEIGRGRIERRLRVTRRGRVDWYSTVPIIQLNHRTGTDIGGGPGRIKKHGQIKAIDIPYWGKAEDIVNEYHR